MPNTSISSRQATAGGYATSLGPGARPQSRPPSASTFHQSVNGRQRANTTRARPATAMGHRAVEDDPETGNQKNCRKRSAPFPPQSSQERHGSMRDKALRSVPSVPAFSSQTQRASNRQASLESLVRGFGGLSIEGRVTDGWEPKGSQVNSSICYRSSGHPCHGATVDNATSWPGLRDEVAGHIDCPPTNSQETPKALPKTPARPDQAKVELEKLEAVVRTVIKTPRSPAKLSPTKPSFLTKESNILGFSAWDMDERLNNVESQFRVMKEAMDVSLTDRKTLEDAVDVAKTRGE